MPEGDNVHRLAARLHRALAGARIARTELRVPRLADVDLAGQTVAEVIARGKHLLMRTDAGLTIHSHLKMEGEWRLYRGARRVGARNDDARAVVIAGDWTAVGVRLGALDVIPRAREPDVVGHLGPDPLGEDWDLDEAARRLATHRGRPIGETLLDQSVVAGFGNVYRSEMLFVRGLDPWTPTEQVPDARALLDLGARMIRANRSRARRVTTGEDRPGRRLWVYGRAGEPCLRCATRIARRDDEERVTFWCPRCQPAPA